eukprot:scaffold25.g5094.t1
MLRTSSPAPTPLADSVFDGLDHPTFMRRAIELSKKGGITEKTGGCFGACVVDAVTGKIVGEGYNHVVACSDPTWHGEMQAIREACSKRGHYHLHNCVVYTSAEPCPMCYCACMWARVSRVYYAATYSDVKHYGKFEDEDFMGELGRPPTSRVIPCLELLRAEAVEVWKTFAAMPDSERCHY